MDNKRILIVEDDKNISKLIRYNLEKEGYHCSIAITGEEALDILRSGVVDLLILDIMLPGVDGFELMRIIKRDDRLRMIPIIILTAKGEEVDRVVGFELGADDYVVKPFSPRELLLRIKAILRRSHVKANEKEVISIGDLVVDIPKHKVTIKGKEISLTPMEFKLLTILLQRRGRVQGRERLLSDVWGIDAIIETRTVDTHIKRLREKLGKFGYLIETVRGVGYRFKEL